MTRLRSLVRLLWRDEAGNVISSEMVLLGTILTLGSLTGLVTIRDAVATELGDVATALINMDHSYSYAPVDTDCGSAAGSQFIDRSDFCAPGLSDDDPPEQIGPIFIGDEPTGGEGI